MLHGQRISTILNRLWADAEHNATVLTLMAASAIALVWLASIGLIEVAEQARDWWRARCARRIKPAAHEPEPEPLRQIRPTCAPRPPTAFEIWDVIQSAERITRGQHDRTHDEDASP